MRELFQKLRFPGLSLLGLDEVDDINRRPVALKKVVKVQGGSAIERIYKIELNGRFRRDSSTVLRPVQRDAPAVLDVRRVLRATVESWAGGGERRGQGLGHDLLRLDIVGDVPLIDGLVRFWKGDACTETGQESMDGDRQRTRSLAPRFKNRAPAK